MQKKVMTLAVAGALAAPALAFAQASTVGIYGVFNVEYGISVKQPENAAGASRISATALNSGASRIGLRGEEKLGGGLSAWFQCESDLRFLSGTTAAPGPGATTGVWCDRNSALGLRGAWGNVFIGSWDSPIKIVSGVTRITEETGWTGTQLFTLSPNSHPTNNSGFSNRLANSVSYHSPSWGGFSLMGQATITQAERNALTTATVSGREVGIAGQFAQGPFAVVAGYAKKDDNIAVGNAAGRSDKAWLLGGTYTYGPVKVGLTYAKLEWDVSATTQTERKGWNLAADWQLGGPHSIRGGYARAGDYGGTASVADSGAKQWQINYRNSLSKRTTAGIGYVKLSNDSSGRYNLTGQTAGAANVAAGKSASAWSLFMNHSF